MKCNKCGFENTSDSRFCVKCGYNIEKNNNTSTKQSIKSFNLKKLIKSKKFIVSLIIIIFSISSCFFAYSKITESPFLPIKRSYEWCDINIEVPITWKEEYISDMSSKNVIYFSSSKELIFLKDIGTYDVDSISIFEIYNDLSLSTIKESENTLNEKEIIETYIQSNIYKVSYFSVAGYIYFYSIYDDKTQQMKQIMFISLNNYNNSDKLDNIVRSIEF